MSSAEQVVTQLLAEAGQAGATSDQDIGVADAMPGDRDGGPRPSLVVLHRHTLGTGQLNGRATYGPAGPRRGELLDGRPDQPPR